MNFKMLLKIIFLKNILHPSLIIGLFVGLYRNTYLAKNIHTWHVVDVKFSYSKVTSLNRDFKVQNFLGRKTLFNQLKANQKPQIRAHNLYILKTAIWFETLNFNIFPIRTGRSLGMKNSSNFRNYCYRGQNSDLKICWTQGSPITLIFGITCSMRS